MPGEASNLSTPVAFKPVDGYRSAMMWSYAGAAFAATGTDVREVLSPANGSWPRPAASLDPTPADHGTERIGVKGHCNDDEGNNADVNITWDGHRFQYEPSTSGELEEDLEGGLGILLAFLEDGHGGCDEDDHLEIHVEIGGIRFAFCVFGDGSFAFGKACPHTSQDPSVGDIPDLYDDQENRICLVWCYFVDTDGDGTVDGRDNDDDGDRLTDEYEGKNALDHKESDIDADDVIDALDVVPGGQAVMNIEPTSFRGSDKCDDPWVNQVSGPVPDPYIADVFSVSTPGPDHSLVHPPDWTEESHVDDRTGPSGLTLNAIGDNGGTWSVQEGKIPMTENIKDYPIDNPRDTVITLELSLRDHDHRPAITGGNEELDLSQSSSTKGVWEFPIVTKDDVPETQTQKGGDECWAKMGFEFDTPELLRCYVEKALLAKGEVVHYADGKNCG